MPLYFNGFVFKTIRAAQIQRELPIGLLLAIVTGISKYTMGKPKPMAIPATTGANTATKATLLISSVIKSIRKISRVAVRSTLMSLAAIIPATKSTIPVTDIPLARAKPPPKSIKMPQANCCVSFHSRIKLPFLR